MVEQINECQSNGIILYEECFLNVCRGKHIFIALLKCGTWTSEKKGGRSSCSLGTG
jgi:hypothetical protein